MRYAGELEGVKTQPRVRFGRGNSYYDVGNHIVWDKLYTVPRKPAFDYAVVAHAIDRACEEVSFEWTES